MGQFQQQREEQFQGLTIKCKIQSNYWNTTSYICEGCMHVDVVIRCVPKIIYDLPFLHSYERKVMGP